MGKHHTPTTPHEHTEEVSGEVRDELRGEGITIPDDEHQLDEHLQQQNFNALHGLDSPDSQASAEYLQNHHAHEVFDRIREFGPNPLTPPPKRDSPS